MLESGDQHQKVTTSCINPLRTGCVLDESVSTSYPCDLISLHWFLSGDIFLVGDFCRLRWWRLCHWHLGVDICSTAVTSHIYHLTLVRHPKGTFVQYLSKRLTSAVPIVNLEDTTIFEGYKKQFEFLVSKGHKTKLNIMDNQASRQTKWLLTQN